jgi:hypothetical protein
MAFSLACACAHVMASPVDWLRFSPKGQQAFKLRLGHKGYHECCFHSSFVAFQHQRHSTECDHPHKILKTASILNAELAKSEFTRFVLIRSFFIVGVGIF